MEEQKVQNKIDYLKEDKPFLNQNYVCISFVSPEGVRNTTIRGLKIRGVFEKLEDAQEHAKKLQEEDPAFHIYVGEVGKWLPWDPSPEDKTKVKDSQYYEKELQKLVEGYEKNRERASKAENERKRELLQKSLQTAKQNKKNTDNKSKPNVVKQINQKSEEKNISLEKEKERLTINENEIKQNEQTLRSLDDNLNKLKDIYEKMQQKKNNN